MNEEVEEFRKLSKEEYELLSEDERQDYSRRHDEEFRKNMKNIEGIMKEIIKTVELLKKEERGE